jgi:hypothetical protein
LNHVALKKCALLAGLPIIFLSAGREAAAIGLISVESSSFMERASDRGDSSTTFVLGPQWSFDGAKVEANFDVRAVTFLADSSSSMIADTTVMAGNAYVATSHNLMPHHQITLGQRKYDWSVADENWNMGLWNARFIWDPLRPETVGLTGAFYTYESAAWRILGFATPISIPERGYPIREASGQLVASSPFYIPPYQAAVVMNQVVPISYTISQLQIANLIFKPGAALSVRYGKEQGPWASLQYGLMPMHQLDLAVDAGLALNGGNDIIEATVYPRVLFQHLVTLEGGYHASDFAVWASSTGEAPLQQAAPADWSLNDIGPAAIVSAGAELKIQTPLSEHRDLSLSGSILIVQEDKAPVADGQLSLDLPSRFPFTRAAQFDVRWQASPKLLTDVKWITDIAQASRLISADVNWLPKGPWILGVGADLISSDTGQGLIGQYVGDDRVRLKVAYAF